MSVTGYCSHHQGSVDKADGRWISSANGRTRRWVCKRCAENILRYRKRGV